MACGCTIRNAFALGLVLLAATSTAPSLSTADPIAAGVVATVSDGYARLVFTMGEDVDASVRVSGNVLIVSFSKPVFISVDRLSMQAPDYIGAARRDPDGNAIRVALARKVKVNSTGAAEKFFVDLLPDTWNGPSPGLPQAVVEELARRAREAERLERLAHQATQHEKLKPVHVRVARQPTFMRYVFDVPDQATVSADRAKDRLTLSFDAPVKFDLTDAVAALPAAIAEIHSEKEENSALVRFAFLAKVDVRTFRDDKSYVVDVVGADNKPAEQGEGIENASPDPASPVGPPEKAAAEGAAPSISEAPVAPSPEKPTVAAPATTVALPSESPAAPTASQPTSNSDVQGPAATSPAVQTPAVQSAAAALATTTVAPAPGSPAAPMAPQPNSTPVAQGPAAQSPAAGPAVQSAAPAPAATTATPAPESPAAPTAPKPNSTPTAQGPSAQNPAAQTPAAPTSVQAPAALPAPPPADKAETPSVGAKIEPPAIGPQPAVPSTAAAAPAAAASDDKAAAPRVAPRAANADRLAVELSRQGANLKLSFPFVAPTAAAVFNRADTLWIVFDSKAAIDLSALEGETSRTIRGVDFTHAPDADIVRLRLDHPHLSSVSIEGPVWTVTIGDTVLDPTRALEIARNMIGPNRSSVTIPFEEPHQLHRISDPDVGDQLFVVTGFGPARGFINAQDFVEFHALASTQGVVVEPLADDVNVELAADKVVVSRPGGLALSSSLHSVLNGSGLRPVTFDSQLWGLDRGATYSERQSHLVAAAAAAPPTKRLTPRLDLARFYIARDMYPEAKGVLDVALVDSRPAAEDVSARVLRAIAEVMMNRPEDALKDLADPAVGDQHDAPLWRALAYAHQGKWAQAREGFKSVEAAIATLPIELQRIALKDEMRAAIEVGDFAGAADELNDFETIGVPRELQPAVSLLIGRLSEGMGRSEDALAAYRTAADSWDRPAAAQGRLRETVLRFALGDLKRDDVVTELETLTTIWRGDETEVEALQILARLYTDEGRYRDSFYVMRSAMSAHPDWDMTRRIQEEAAKTFETLFLAGKGDAMPAIDALALFYDFRELTPIGRRGDEMIRRLADRLVSVDLLDQAADLLQYQVDHRLQGAARAQVATRLAVIYLMNRKADRALAALRATRTADVSNELRTQRLLLEARALSDLGRHDLALEVTARIEGREAVRLRADILWTARRWSQSAEQIELYYGDHWKQWQPLNEAERADILRAAIGYALGEDALGLNRFREKYAAKMAQTPDARAFEVVSAPLGTSGTEFRDIAHAAASVDTLEGFLRDMQARYPEARAISQPAPASAAPAAAAPAPASKTPAASSAPGTLPAAPAPPVPPSRASGRTAQR